MNRTNAFTPRLESLDGRAVPAFLGGLGSAVGTVLDNGTIFSYQPDEAVQAEQEFNDGAGTWGGQGNPDAQTQQEQATQAELDYLAARSQH